MAAPMTRLLIFAVCFGILLAALRSRESVSIAGSRTTLSMQRADVRGDIATAREGLGHLHRLGQADRMVGR